MKIGKRTILLSTSLVLSLGNFAACGESGQANTSSVPAVAEDAAAPLTLTKADAYAPLLAIPKNLPNDPGAGMIAMMSANSIVPAATEVNVPVYPGAQIMSAMGSMEMMSNGVRQISLPSMSLLSADGTAEIVAFYQEKLRGWQYQEFYGSHSFWNGGEDSNPLDITGQFSLVTVTPLPESDTARTLWPKMQNRIDVRYEPDVPETK